MKLSDYLADLLATAGAKDIFAISGAGNVHLLDSIARHPALSYICPHHEQAGVMAAIAYARTCPHRGVMVTTGGPGAANAVIGVLDAPADSMPVVVISGQEKSAHVAPASGLRMWGVQGFDIVRCVSGMCKYAVTILDPQSVRYHVERALHESVSGRPGPVWLDVPMDVQSAEVEPGTLRGFEPPPSELSGGADQLAEIIGRLKGARRPVLILGHAFRLAGAERWVDPIVERWPGAVITSWAAADLVDGEHPKHFGHAGVYGQRRANFVVQNCDLLLAVGTRLAIPQVGYAAADFARHAYRAMVDIDATELAKFAGVFECLVQADLAGFAPALAAALGDAAIPSAEEWLGVCRGWRERYPLVEPGTHASAEGCVNSYAFIDRLSDHFAPGELVVTDMGTALTCTHQAIKLRRGQRLVTTTGLGEMGFGLPGAIGVAAANPGQRVILVIGDGSIMMNLQEFQTVATHRYPIKIFLYTNDGYLTIKHTQAALLEGRFTASGSASGVDCPDFLKVAAAFGLRTVSIDGEAAMDAGIRDTLAGDDAVVCVVRMDPLQPLVPKLSVAVGAGGNLVSPPLEDLSPLLPRDVMRREMISGMHPMSEEL